MKRRLLATLLTSTLMLGLLAGCTPEENETPTGVTTQEGTTGATETTEELPEASDEIMHIGDVSFDLWTQIHPVTAEKYKSLNDHPAASQWTEATGVSVNYISPPVGEERTNLNLLLTDPKSMPDAFQIAGFDSMYPGGITLAIEDNVILDITEMVEMYAPNFMAMVNADENLKKDVYNDDGIMVGFGTVVVNEEKRGSAMRGPIINEGLLEEAGLDIPVTIDDWTEMLRAFKDLGVEHPLSMDPAYFKNVFSGAYGVTTGAEYYIDVEGDGKVHFSPYEDAYKDYLMLMNSWVEEGLLDPDWATVKLTQDIRPMMADGSVGATLDYVTMFKQFPINAAALGLEQSYVAAPYPVLEEGDQIHLRDYEANRTGLALFVSASAEDPISIIKWVDQMYSLEGRYLNTFGEEGVTYEYVDGALQYTDYITANEEGISQTQAGRYFIFKDLFKTWEDEDHKLIYTEDSQYDAWDQWNKADTEGEMPTLITLTPDEADEAVKLKTTLDDYVNQMRIKFINGTESFDNWDDYIATLETLGVEEAIAIQQSAYDRYVNR